MRVSYFVYDDFPEAEQAVLKYAPEAEFVDVTATSYAYWDAIEERWQGKEDLVTIEQDVVLVEGVIQQFRECPEDWCLFVFGGHRQALGCTRFSARLQRAVPASEIRKRARRRCAHCGAPHFAFIDGPISDSLIAAGYEQPHRHEPELRHLSWDNPWRRA